MTTLEVKINNISCRYGSRTVVDEVTLNVHPGELLAVCGPNGSGKSTLLHAIAGLHPIDAGTVQINGSIVQQLRTRQRARSVCLLPQSPSAPTEWTAESVVALGRYPHRRLVRGLSPSDHQAVNEAMIATGCDTVADRPIGTLSGGERQRVWLAMAICQQSPALLLDEPTSALDVGHQLDVLTLVRQLAVDGLAVVIVLHDLSLASRFADRIALLDNGRLRCIGPPDEVLGSSELAAAFGVSVTLIDHPAGERTLPIFDRDRSR